MWIVQVSLTTHTTVSRTRLYGVMTKDHSLVHIMCLTHTHTHTQTTHTHTYIQVSLTTHNGSVAYQTIRCDERRSQLCAHYVPLSLSLSLSHTHTHTHTHTHIYIYTSEPDHTDGSVAYQILRCDDRRSQPCTHYVSLSLTHRHTHTHVGKP